MDKLWIDDPLITDIFSEIDANRMWELVSYFSTLNRESGRSDEHKAFRYIVDQLEQAKIPVDVYEFQAYLSHPISAGLEVYSPVRRSFRALTHSFSGNTPPHGITGEIVFIGSPDFDPGMEMDTSLFDALDLKGKIVIADGLVRPWKTRIAQEKGALALINVNATEQLHNMIVSTVWGTPGIDEMGNIPSIPVISISREEGQALIRMCQRGKVHAAVQSETESDWFPVILPVARIEGRNPDKFALIHGHLDSWHVGATDNATGNATKLELARVLHTMRDRLNHSIRVAWWPGHSTGRYAGSTWYADHFWNDIFENAIVDINVDSTGVRNATHAIPKQTYELTDFVSQEVSRFIQRDLTADGAEFISVGRQGRHADQSFWNNCGSNIRLDFMIPPDHPDCAKVGGSGGGFWWHTEHDTLDKADRGCLERDTRLTGLIAAAMVNSDVFPFDHRAVADAILQRLNAIQQICRETYSLEKSLNAATNFKKSCQILHQEVEVAKQKTDDSHKDHVNRKMLKLNRILTPAVFTEIDMFRHQPAEPAKDLPGLSRAESLTTLDPDSNRAGFTRAQLIREENRLMHALKQTEEVILSGSGD